MNARSRMAMRIDDYCNVLYVIDLLAINAWEITTVTLFVGVVIRDLFCVVIRYLLML